MLLGLLAAFIMLPALISRLVEVIESLPLSG
jgi:hypothetical protein